MIGNWQRSVKNALQPHQRVGKRGHHSKQSIINGRLEELSAIKRSDVGGKDQGQLERQISLNAFTPVTEFTTLGRWFRCSRVRRPPDHMNEISYKGPKRDGISQGDARWVARREESMSGREAADVGELVKRS